MHGLNDVLGASISILFDEVFNMDDGWVISPPSNRVCVMASPRTPSQHLNASADVPRNMPNRMLNASLLRCIGAPRFRRQHSLPLHRVEFRISFAYEALNRIAVLGINRNTNADR